MFDSLLEFPGITQARVPRDLVEPLENLLMLLKKLGPIFLD